MENKLNQSTVISKVSKSLKELMSAITNENKALEIGKVAAMETIVEEKVAALQKFNEAQIELEDYARQGAEFDQNTSAMSNLRTQFNKFNELSQRNEVLIRSNLEVSNTIVKIYKKNKKQEALRKMVYNKDGQISAADNIEKIMPSIGLNNKV